MSAPSSATPSTRPTTALTRPKTSAADAAAKNQPSGSAIIEEGEDHESDDEDPGMFTFLPPTESSVASPNASAYVTSPNTPFTNQPSVKTSGSALGLSAPPSAVIPGSPLSTRLSPAAAYALAASKGQAPPTTADESGARKRGSWAHSGPVTPDFVTSDPLGSKRQPTLVSFSHVDSERPFSWSESDRNSRGTSILENAQSMQMDAFGKARSMASDDAENKINLDAYDQYDLDALMEEEEDSPYPEVRASVSNIDDPEMPCLTFRSWFIGLTFSILFGAINLFLDLRYPAPIITPIVVQVLSYPAGKFLAWVLPIKTWTLPERLQKWGWGDDISLNPGPFNIKEHTVIILMANAALSPAFGINFTLAVDKFYNIPQGVGLDFLLVITTQMIGFGLAGICRRFLVWPASLIWPQNLVFCTLLNTMHAEDDDGRDGSVTRFRFFIYVFCGAFMWYFLPGFLFQALSYFSFICWIAPNNVIINQLFGVSTGLGLSALTFDWSQISYIGSPLVVPWWAEVNIFVGFVLIFWIICPAIYYSNTWFAAFMPISSSGVYDRFGMSYNTSLVTNADATLNVTAYEQYSPLYLPVTYAGLYALSFGLAMACIVHCILYHGPSILRQIKRIKGEEEDVHFKLMRNYPEVPDWWYWGYLIVFAALSIIMVELYPVQFPVWALLLALLLAFVYVLPGGYIFAMTSQQIAVNLLVEMIAGYMMPGNPLGNMLFKIYAIQGLLIALSFVQDLKLGHYMKIPPRATFLVQVVSALLSSLAQVGTKQWMLYNVPDLCQDDQPALLICPQAQVFYSASIIWGLIGPHRQFSIGALYNPLLWCLLVGALLPVPFWFFSRKYPQSWLKYVNIPVLLTGATFVPPATGVNYSSWFLFGFICQWWLRRRAFRWWSKFNFVLSAGLDSGTIISGLVIFFVLQLPKEGSIDVNWWGNNVFANTLDWYGVSWKTVPEEGFGRTTW